MSESDRSPYEQGELASSSPEAVAHSEHEEEMEESNEEVEEDQESEKEQGR